MVPHQHIKKMQRHPKLQRVKTGFKSFGSHCQFKGNTSATSANVGAGVISSSGVDEASPVKIY